MSKTTLTAEWQPIETAPKDGTDVMLYRSIWAQNVYAIAGWFEDGWYAFDQPDHPITGASHWMPLPAAPVSSEERRAAE